MKKLLVTLALSTLALTACSGVDEAPTPTPSREASSVAVTQVVEEVTFSGPNESRKAFAEAKYEAWEHFQSNSSPYKKDHAILVGDKPTDSTGKWVKVIDWASPKAGVLVITVEGSDWRRDQLMSLAIYVAGYFEDLDRVKVITEDFSEAATAP